MKTVLTLSITLALGLTAGIWLGQSDTLNPTNNEQGAETATKAKAPLYWVAPMDPNYRRDKPGKSPMGMDLIPVYEETSSPDDAGLITISPRVENNLGVRTQKVTKQPFSSTINTVGMLEFDQNSLWQINSRVSGWVEKLYVSTEGERVKSGQKLLSLYSPELVKAQDEFINALTIGNKKLISSSKNRLRALGINNLQIRRLEKSRTAAQTITLFAPAAGYINKLRIREGAYISPATQIIEAGLLDEVWLQAEIFESQAALVKVGDKAEVRLDSFPGKTWQSEVDYIYPALNAATRTLQVRVKLANPDAILKPNMFATLTLFTQPQSDTLQIPREALIRGGNFDRVVIAKGQGKYQSVRVEAGREFNGFVEITAGLKVGDNVVTSAQFLLDSESSLTADLSRMDPIDHSEMGHSQMDHSQMDHSQMDHSQMDHSQMDHSQMDHSQMDHSQMDHSQMDHSQMDHSQMDHSQMDHSQMDHSQMDHSQMDHSQMDHSQMDHSQMDHSQMDHSQMDHSQMDHSQMDHSQMDHSQMDHSQMDHSQMDHSQMGQSQVDHSQMTETDNSNIEDDDLDWLDLDDPDVGNSTHKEGEVK